MRPIPKSQFNFLVQLCLSQNNVFVGPLAIAMAIFTFFPEIALQNVFALGYKHYPPKLATSTAHQACQEPNLLEMCLIEQQ